MDTAFAGAADARPAWVGASAPGRAALETPAWVVQATAGFVALGILLRVARYLLNFPLWCDETMIAANFLDRGYLDLFRPLDYRQVAPVLWLAVELTSVKVLGFSELSLRLFPAVCGVASVPLFRHVAGRVVSGVPFLLAVAVFAVSGWPLRYGAEVKPYASDLFVALAILALAIEWWRSREQVEWLWALAAAGPLAVALSLPALFVLGGVGLALAWPVWRCGRRDMRLALGLFGAGVVLTFLVLAPFYRTAPQDHDYFHNAWASAFPPLDSAWRLAVWFLDVNTGYLFAYPEGGEHGASALTFLAFSAGAVVLWRRGRRLPVAFCLVPFVLALGAAAIHRYPYGVSARTSQYAVPMICLLAGTGLALALARIPSDLLRRRALGASATALAVLGLGHLGYDLSHPYKTPSDERARAFARWFWTELSRDGELVCLRTDLGLVLNPLLWDRGASDTYLCYQRIYSPRHSRRAAPDFARVSPVRPLRYVVFNDYPDSNPVFIAWLAEQSRQYDLHRVLPYNVSTLEPRPGPTQNQVYIVYEFVPKSPAVAGGLPGTARR
jgi:hypothetical protein